MYKAERSRAIVSTTPWQPRTATPMEDAHARVVDAVKGSSRETDCKGQVSTTILPFQEGKLTHIDSADSRESWTACDERCCRYRDMIQVSTMFLNTVLSSVLSSSSGSKRLIISFAQNAQSVLLMKLAQGLWQQDSDDVEKAQVTVIEYNAEGQPLRKDCNNSQQLLQYLDQEERPIRDPQQNRVQAPGVRRIFILGDLSRRDVEILGSRLKIHPIPNGKSFWIFFAVAAPFSR